MREGGERILSGRRTMHESHRPERGLAGEPAGNREAGTASDGDPPDCRELREEIVRMLVVDERRAIERLPDLKDLTIAVLTDGGRVEAEHPGERHHAFAGASGRHAHPPVRHDELLASARTALPVELG